MTRKSTRGHLRRAAYHLLAILVLFGLSVSLTTAQGSALTIEQASLRLWSEYDDPGLLVIFTGNFADTGAFPQPVAFPIADGARNIQATYRDGSGNLLVREYTVTDGKLTYEMPLPAFHYEYYVDRLPSGDQREITFEFDPGYTTRSLEIVIQQPARATDFSMTPAEQSNYRGEDGLTYHVSNLTNLAPGQPQNIVIRYTKTDSNLSKPQLAVTDGGTAATAAAAPGAGRAWLPYVLIGIGVAALVAALVYWLLGERRTKPAPAIARGSAGGKRTGAAARPAAPATARSSSPRPTVRAASPAPAGTGTAFCTQCGHALQPSDRFCPQCGTQRG